MKSTRCVGFKAQDDWYPPDPDEPNFVLEEDLTTVQAANQKSVANRIRVTFSATRNQLGGALFEEALRNFVVTPEFAGAEYDPDQAMQTFPEFIEAYVGSKQGCNLADLARFDLALRAVAMTANVERAANPKGSRALDQKLRCGSP